MYVEGRVLTSSGEPIPGAVIETWETDDKGEPPTVRFRPFSFSLLTVDYVLPPTQGYYDTQYTERPAPDCRGRLKTDEQGRYGYRAIVPVAYPIPGDVRLIFPPSLSHFHHLFGGSSSRVFVVLSSVMLMMKGIGPRG